MMRWCSSTRAETFTTQITYHAVLSTKALFSCIINVLCSVMPPFRSCCVTLEQRLLIKLGMDYSNVISVFVNQRSN
jgi:hypothetical protein